MTSSQKVILVSLIFVTGSVLLFLGVLLTALVWPSPPAAASMPTAVLAAPAAMASPAALNLAADVATPLPAATAQPTPTGTRVVVVTVLPTPTPTRANCINAVRNFEASGVISSQEVQNYLRQTLPLAHLDHCRGIEYVPRRGSVHGTTIAGNIIPVYREIYVYLPVEAVDSADTLLDIVIHELGHNVHLNLRREGFELDETWRELYEQSQRTYEESRFGFVSDYARQNRYEDFAESYLAYIRYPDTLIYYNRDKYDFMRREIFAGREYSPAR